MSSYELLVIGGGAAGLAAARAARRSGHTVALVEAGPLGGDCTHYGCVPSKTLLDLAHRVTAVREAAAWGLPPVGDVAFDRVMARVREVVADVERDESAERLAAEGIDVVRGWARFTGRRTVSVAGRRLTAGKVVLATGSQTAVPPIPGLADVPHLDNRTVFALAERPEHLVVLGAGSVGVELAQAFAGLGARVTLLEAGPRVLASEEPEASAVVERVLRAGGVDVRTGVTVERVSPRPVLHLAGGEAVAGSHLLVATGRRAATDGLEVEAAGIALDDRGQVRVDRHLRSTNPDVCAAGDCATTGDGATALRYTHVADEQGRLAAGNALGRRATAFDDRVVPRVTFTAPEVGRVGLTEAQAFARYGDSARVAVLPMAQLDRARTAGATDGFLKLITAPRRLAPHPLLDRLVGLTAVMPAGGELAATGAVVMRSGMLAARLAQTVSPYPTYSLGLRMAAARLLPTYREAGSRPARPGGE